MISMPILLFICSIFLDLTETIERRKYRPTWRDLDSHPLPQWYDSAKIGILIHWGVYSVIGYPEPGEEYKGSELLWKRWTQNEPGIDDYLLKKYGKHVKYQDFAQMFTASHFDPNSWAEIFAKAGAGYVILTTKHQDGFALFRSHNSSEWNSIETGPKLDLVKIISSAVRRQGMKFGVYYSFHEWFNPLFWNDQATGFMTTSYADSIIGPDIRKLVLEYRPSILWPDGHRFAEDTYWNSRSIISWIYGESPVAEEIVVNDRWGSNDVVGKHGDTFVLDKVTARHFESQNSSELLNHKWENLISLDTKSFGFRRNLSESDVLSIQKLVKIVVMTVAYGGNVLINVGPTHEGEILDLMKDRLLQLGEWMSINGNAIYGTSPWFYQRDSLNPRVWYTCRRTKYNSDHPTALPEKPTDVSAIYAIFFYWPKANTLKVRDLAKFLKDNIYKIDLVQGEDTYKTLEWGIEDDEVIISLPDKFEVKSNYGVTLYIRVNTNEHSESINEQS